ncbi:MAG: site-specific DNA-methyltransferase [Chloroflexi bacterium]|nr:site-specific DNA-methyltransferase [Chloroflexota bacterium]
MTPPGPSERSSKRLHTRTSSFGSPGRIGHDASKFYGSRLYDGKAMGGPDEYVENPIEPASLDRVYCKSSENMDELPDYSVHLMVTSPPYNVTKEYDEDLTLDEYRGLLKRVFGEVYRKLVTGGRACVNLANVGRKPYIALHSYVIQDMQEMGYMMRGEIIWNKAAGSGPSTAWGSWRSAANPTLRDVHEYILVFSKESFSRSKTLGTGSKTLGTGSKTLGTGQKLPGKESTISRDEFLEFTKSVWTFPAESAQRVGHPAPFPVELPYRLIQLYTFKGDVVLDPFCGSGSTCVAALKAGRHYVGYDTKEDYVRLAEGRISEYGQQLSLIGKSLSPSSIEGVEKVSPSGEQGAIPLKLSCDIIES